MIEPAEENLGPAMRALAPLQRRFVFAMLSDPLGSATSWAKTAGYSQASGAAKQRAHELMHKNWGRIQDAALELAREHLMTLGPVIGIGVMLQIAKNKQHKDQLKAAAMLANRSGFHETTQHVVNVTHSDRRGEAMAERIKVLASALGMDAAQLLGVNEAEPVKMIEGKVEDGAGDHQD